MIRTTISLFAFIALTVSFFAEPTSAEVVDSHVRVASEPGRFFGWPANGGAWAWGDEIVAVFKEGKMDVEAKGHLIDRKVPQIDVQARSTDGGRTWTLERQHQFVTNDRTVKKLESPINFRHPNFAVMFRHQSINAGKTYTYYTYDRCRTWEGPFELPLFGEAFTSGRTCVLIEGPREMYAFLGGAPEIGREFGTHVFMVHTTDGGMNWTKISDVGPPSHPDKWFIMPSAVRVSKDEIVCAIRYNDKGSFGIEIWGSADNGRSWQHRATLPVGSAPPSLEYLDGDRLFLMYGRRIKPCGVSARLSRDRGKTWDDEIVFRNDGGSGDLGYTRNVFRSDGKGVLIYYFTPKTPKADRTIEATLWNPDAVGRQSAK